MAHYHYNILIVEDQLIIATDIAMHLTKAGYHVVGIHRHAEDAIKTIEKQRPDIVLVDINLAGTMDGIQLANHILKTSKIPVIFLTSLSDNATFRQVIKAKPHAYILKPFDRIGLLQSIERVSAKITKPGQIPKKTPFKP